MKNKRVALCMGVHMHGCVCVCMGVWLCVFVYGCVPVCGCVWLCVSVCVCVWLHGLVGMLRLACIIRFKVGLKDEDPIAVVVANSTFETLI